MVRLTVSSVRLPADDNPIGMSNETKHKVMNIISISLIILSLCQERIARKTNFCFSIC